MPNAELLKPLFVRKDRFPNQIYAKPVNWVISVYNVGSALANEGDEAAVKEGATTAGDIIGGWAGGWAGAKIGVLVGSYAGRAGVVIGGIVGGIIGGVGGSIVGSDLGSEVGSYIVEIGWE